MRDKIEAMIKKLELFSVCINKDNTQVFPSLYYFFVCKWTQAYRQCQMWYSEAPEWAGCVITQVLSRNRWHKQLDSLSLSCPASSSLTDIWTFLDRAALRLCLPWHIALLRNWCPLQPPTYVRVDSVCKLLTSTVNKGSNWKKKSNLWWVIHNLFLNI